METAADFRLNSALDGWRASFARMPAVSPEDLRELEDHLLQSWSRSVERGEDPASAFESARAELGTADRLAEDYRLATSPLRILTQHLLEIDMKNPLALSIAFAAILLSLSLFLTRSHPPRYELVEAANGKTLRMDNQTGELCLVASFGAPLDEPDCTGRPLPEARAQEERLVPATLSGVIRDADGNGVEHAILAIDGGVAGSQASTDMFGRFQLFSSTLGVRTVHVVLGRNRYRIEGVELKNGEKTEIEFTVPDSRSGT